MALLAVADNINEIYDCIFLLFIFVLSDEPRGPLMGSMYNTTYNTVQVHMHAMFTTHGAFITKITCLEATFSCKSNYFFLLVSVAYFIRLLMVMVATMPHGQISTIHHGPFLSDHV